MKIRGLITYMIKRIHKLIGRILVKIMPLSFSNKNELSSLISENNNIKHSPKNSNISLLKVAIPTFILFVIIGIVFALFVLRQFSSDTEFLKWLIILRLFRGPFNLILFLYFISTNIYGWRLFKIKIYNIFEIDSFRNPNLKSTTPDAFLFRFAFFLTVAWVLALISFIYSPKWGIPGILFPFILIVILPLAFLLNPFAFFKFKSRLWIASSLFRSIAAPFFKVKFIDFWLADQLCSLVPILLDFEFFFCYLKNYSGESSIGQIEGSFKCKNTRILRAIISALPAWIRFFQCLRQFKDTKKSIPLFNAGKYCTTALVVVFSTLNMHYTEMNDSTFLIPWIISTIISSIYTYIWDIVFDWGLLNPVLREELIYPKIFYFFAMFVNFFLRFSWALTFTEFGIDHNELLVTISAPLEIFRRFIWNFLRLDYEQLNNFDPYILVI